MLRLLERYQTAIVIFFALTLPIGVYRANSIEPANANPLDKVLLAASAPLKHLLSWATGAVSDAWFNYVDVYQARRENGDLRRRLMKAERARDERESLRAENVHLRVMLQIREQNPAATLLPASVIAAGSSPLSRTIEIDRGSIDSVARGMVVISDEGLVGLVLRVGWTTSEVMLIADEKLSFASVVVRSRSRGRTKGNGLWPGFGLELLDVLRADDARVGDRIATSGLGGVFPKGIPVGEVTQVRTPTGAQHRIADVEPYVDFARLEQVMVLVSSKKGEPLVTPEPLRPRTLRSEGPLGGPGPTGVSARDAGAAIASDAGRSSKALDAGKGVRDAGDAGAADGRPPDAARSADASKAPDAGLVFEDIGAIAPTLEDEIPPDILPHLEDAGRPDVPGRD